MAKSLISFLIVIILGWVSFMASAAVHPPARGEKKEPPSVKGDELVYSGPLLSFEISQYQLLEVILDQKMPRALLKDPTGKTHLIQVGDFVGAKMAVVGDINSKGIILKEKVGLADEAQPRLLPLKTSKGEQTP